MDKITPADAMVAALLGSVCDVVAAYVLETRAIVHGLEQKGIFSFSEWQEAKAKIPPETVSQVAAQLHGEMQKRIAQRYQEILGSGTIQ